jgi:WhiB family transcriptional regulator, redox-sensing transcriptional regulator
MLAERREEDEDNRQWLWARARCNDGTAALVELFFSEQLDDIARAKALCAECPVREVCFEEARDRREPYGVWGGRLFYKGRVLAVKRPRGRPSKAAKPAESKGETLIA